MPMEAFQLLYWSTVRIVRAENDKSKPESDIALE